MTHEQPAAKAAIEAWVERELTLEEKKELSTVWVNLVLGAGTAPEGVGRFTNEQLRAWMYDSLLSEILKVRSEWGLSPNIPAYQEALDAVPAEDLVRKGDIQFKYIDFLNNRISHFDETHPEGLGRPRRWESWPKTMRESRSFNCVGATLFAIASLEEGGIPVLLGNPAGHAVAIGQLADKEYVYIDFNNDTVFVIHPEEKEIGGVACFVIRDPRIEYELIPVFDRHTIVENILGNLSGVPAEVKRGDHESAEQESRTRAIYTAAKESFDTVDFLKFKQVLYGPDADPWNRNSDPAFEVEFRKVKLLHDFLSFVRSHAPELERELKDALVVHGKEIKALMLDIRKDAIPGVSPALLQLLKKAHVLAWQWTRGNTAAIEQAVDHLSFQLSNRAKKLTPPEVRE